jgi:hypothetical protein
MKKIIMFASIVLCADCYAYTVLEDETDYKSVSIYFVDWAYNPRYVLNPSQVREEPHMAVSIHNQVYIQNIEFWLNTSLLKPIGDIDNFRLGETRDRQEVAEILSKKENKLELINVRLVVDLHRKDGSKETYLSDGRWLYDSTAERARSISQKFKERIDALVSEPVDQKP